MEGWKQKEAAERFAKTADILAPRRREILSIISRLATEGSDQTPLILDLGSGLGDVTEAILAQRERAKVHLVDFSDEMVRLSRKRFDGNPNVSISKHDLNDALPDFTRSREFDSVVSCFALHHVELENRVRLYSEIRRCLKDGGLFINGDLFKGDSPLVDQWLFDDWIRWIEVQMKVQLGEERSFDEWKSERLETMKKMGDKPGTVWEMYDDMECAGFRHVDILWKFQNLAILAAMK